MGESIHSFESSLRWHEPVRVENSELMVVLPEVPEDELRHNKLPDISSILPTRSLDTSDGSTQTLYPNNFADHSLGKDAHMNFSNSFSPSTLHPIFPPVSLVTLVVPEEQAVTNNYAHIQEQNMFLPKSSLSQISSCELSPCEVIWTEADSDLKIRPNSCVQSPLPSHVYFPADTNEQPRLPQGVMPNSQNAQIFSPKARLHSTNAQIQMHTTLPNIQTPSNAKLAFSNMPTTFPHIHQRLPRVMPTILPNTKLPLSTHQPIMSNVQSVVRQEINSSNNLCISTTPQRKDKQIKRPMLKRPLNSFLLWLRDNRHLLTTDPIFASKTHVERTRMWSVVWKKIPSEMKKRYEEESKRRREEFSRKLDRINQKYCRSRSSTGVGIIDITSSPEHVSTHEESSRATSSGNVSERRLLKQKESILRRISVIQRELRREQGALLRVEDQLRQVILDASTTKGTEQKTLGMVTPTGRRLAD